MRVLVSAASKHDATAEIARTIGQALEASGIEATVMPPDDVTSLKGYDGVVLGSGVYAGRWLEPAKALMERHAEELRALPVWIFSSGPLGEPLKPEGEPADAGMVIDTLQPREHRIFGGRIDRDRLSMGEKVVLKVVRAPEGDFRPWEEIIEWSREIAASLTEQP